MFCCPNAWKLRLIGHLQQGKLHTRISLLIVLEKIEGSMKLVLLIINCEGFVLSVHINLSVAVINIGVGQRIRGRHKPGRWQFSRSLQLWIRINLFQTSSSNTCTRARGLVYEQLLWTGDHKHSEKLRIEVCGHTAMHREETAQSPFMRTDIILDKADMARWPIRDQIRITNDIGLLIHRSMRSFGLAEAIIGIHQYES